MTGISIRPATERDGPALARAHLASRELHRPWVEPFTDLVGFERWFAPIRAGRKLSFLVEDAGDLAGVVNLGEIVMGGFANAYMGYYAMAGTRRGGAMTTGVALVLRHAFSRAGLHRVEANIQPANARSIALVRRLGFRLEGFSPRYLRIGGEWRDHERWAILADEFDAGLATQAPLR